MIIAITNTTKIQAAMSKYKLFSKILARTNITSPFLNYYNSILQFLHQIMTNIKKIVIIFLSRRNTQVVEGTGFENQQRLIACQGSNPCFSANLRGTIMSKKYKSFNMNLEPNVPNWFWHTFEKTVSWFMCGPLGTKSTIKRINCEGLKGPYLVLSNHASFIDFPHNVLAMKNDKSCWVASVEEFIGIRSWLFDKGVHLSRHRGCACQLRRAKL